MSRAEIFHLFWRSFGLALATAMFAFGEYQAGGIILLVGGNKQLA